MVVVDFSSKTNGHFMFNASVLKGLNSKVNLKFYANETNNKIFEFCKKNKIDNLKIKEKPTYLQTIFIAFYKAIVFNKSKKFTLLAFDNSLLPFLFVLNSIVLKTKKIELTIILHNNLDTLKKVIWKQKLFKLMLKIYKPKIILLSPFMEDEFSEIFKYSSFKAVFHQNYRELIKENFPNLLKQKESKINISISNSHSKIFINEKIYKFFSNSRNNNLLVRYIHDKPVMSETNFLFQRTARPEKEYDYLNYIYSSDYVFFPIDESANMRASGVLVDTLSLGVNFIAPNIGHFRDINRKFGLGLLYKDYSELPEILNILNKSENITDSKFLEETKIENLLKAIHFE